MSNRELLDVEDDDARQQRIQSLLESTDATQPRQPQGPALHPLRPASKPHPVPLSDLISRAEAFLPRLAAANAELAQRDPTSVDMEHLGDAGDDAPHIEMNLGLGVFEQKQTSPQKSPSSSSQDPSPTFRSPETPSTAPTTADPPGSSSASSDSDSDDDDDDDSDSDSDGSIISAIPPEEARALEAILSPRAPSSTLQQQQQQAHKSQSPTQPPRAAPKPSIVVLTSDLDIDMGPQTARGWEEE